jgi:DNA-binding transcriptional regulator YdaS (Cro superfamily)
MTPADRLLKHFKTRKAFAMAFGVTEQTISNWINGGLPIHRAVEIERVSGGAVRVEQIFRAARKKVSA